MISTDGGKTWAEKGQLLGGPGRPYVRYADDAHGNIHFIATEQYPRNFDNSVYHGKLVGSQVQNSVGEVYGELGDSPPPPESELNMLIPSRYQPLLRFQFPKEK